MESTSTGTRHAMGQGRITFRTTGTWSTGDLVSLIRTVEALYGALAYGESGTHLLHSGQFMRIDDDEEGYQDMVRLLDHGQEVSEGLVKFSSLTIAAIRMESPGFISFEGFGPAIDAMREFVKDLWYRNRAEARAASRRDEKEEEQAYWQRKLDAVHFAQKYARERARLHELRDVNYLNDERFVSDLSAVLVFQGLQLTEMVTAELLQDVEDQTDVGTQ